MTTERFWIVFIIYIEVMLVCSAYPSESKPKTAADTNAKQNESSEDKVLSCDEEIRSMYVEEKFIGKVPQYDLLKILQDYGGAPGMIDVSAGDGSNGKQDRKSRTQDDPKKINLVYNYRRSDNKTFIRLEKAFRTPVKSTNQSLEISGEFFWYPDNFCGWMRRADYKLNQNGFSANVHYGTKCELGILFPKDSDVIMLSCVPASHCSLQNTYCVAGAFVTPIEQILQSN